MWCWVNSGAGWTAGLMILDVFFSPSGSGSISLNERSRKTQQSERQQVANRCFLTSVIWIESHRHEIKLVQNWRASKKGLESHKTNRNICIFQEDRHWEADREILVPELSPLQVSEWSSSDLVTPPGLAQSLRHSSPLYGFTSYVPADPYALLHFFR